MMKVTDSWNQLYPQSLSDSDLRDIIERLYEGEDTEQEIADDYLVSQPTISQIWSGVIGEHIPRPYPSGINYNDWRKHCESLLCEEIVP